MNISILYNNYWRYLYDKKEIRAYVERTPENTNWHVLENMLDEFKNTEEVASAEALQAALENGGDVALVADMDVDTMFKLTKDTVLDLNGQAITTSAHMDESDNNALVKITEGNVIIKDGTVDAYSNVEEWDPAVNYNMAVFVHNENSKVVIEDGDFKAGYEAIYVYAGEVTILDGTFFAQPDASRQNKNYILNCYDANYKAGKANIIVKGGTFYGFNPADNGAETSGDKGTNFVAEGFKSVEITPGVFKVLPINK